MIFLINTLFASWIALVALTSIQKKQIKNLRMELTFAVIVAKMKDAEVKRLKNR